MLNLKGFYERSSCPIPSLHCVLGSGLGLAFQSQSAIPKGWRFCGELKFADLAELKATTAPGHAGVFRLFYNEKRGSSFLIQVGRLHGFEGNPPRDVVRPLLLGRDSGISNFLLTNAAGSLKKTFKPGSVMIIEDQINLTGNSPIYGPIPKKSDGSDWGPRFPDMSEAFDKKASKSLASCLSKEKIKVNRGVYIGVNGPAFETPAEVALFAKWGLGAVGMSTVWESIALKHTGARVIGLSIISNFGCGLMKNVKLQHDEVESTVGKVSKKVVNALFNFAEQNHGL
jgi:purine-nucleoside phosphorylase